MVSLCVLQVSLLGSGKLRGAGKYAVMAAHLVRAGVYSLDGQTPTANRVPAYTLVVAFGQLVAGAHWYHFLVWLQGFFSIVTGVLWNRTAHRLAASWWVAPLVTVTCACHVALQWEHLALRETVVFGLLIAWFFYLASSKSITVRTLCTMTVVCVLAYHTRPTGFLMMLPLAGVVALQSGWPIVHRTACAFLAVGGVVLAALPWQLYQTIIAGELVLAPAPVGGVSLYKGNAGAFEYVSPYVDVDAGDFLVRELANRDLEEPQGARAGRLADDRLRELAMADIRSDPARFAKRAALRVVAYLSPLSTPLGSASVFAHEGRLRLDDYRG